MGFVIGAVIYMDAKKRGEHKIKWALIGFLFALPALLIWLFIRSPKEFLNRKELN